VNQRTHQIGALYESGRRQIGAPCDSRHHRIGTRVCRGTAKLALRGGVFVLLGGGGEGGGGGGEGGARALGRRPWGRTNTLFAVI